MSLKRLWIVMTYSDGPLVAYRDERDAIDAKDTYAESGMYPHEETYVEEVLFAEEN